VVKPLVIPFFLPHQGCPSRCLYCNQGLSAGRRPEPLTPEAVDRGIRGGLASPKIGPGRRVEAAFFGGTFTLLPRRRQAALLEAVRPYMEAGKVQGLRLSTRPDALEPEQIEFLKAQGVTTVEIGAQSMDDRVLAAAGRGHTAEQTRQAAGRVKAAGMRLGLQLLLGLPEEDDRSRAATLSEILALAPNEVRLYPLLVLPDVPLAELYRQGLYQPLSLDQAVSVCAEFLQRLTAAGIIVTRIGLQNEPRLDRGVLAGPYHPALGHLVRSEVYGQALRRVLNDRRPDRPRVVFQVAHQDLPQAVGHERRNLKRLLDTFRLEELKFQPDDRLAAGRFAWNGEVFSIWDRSGPQASPSRSRSILP